jgi:hypothetical protein
MNVVRASLIWGESCQCHHHLLHEDAPAELARCWLRCPMRGRRLPEISGGDFLETLTNMFDTALAHLLQTLPAGLPAQQRALLAQDFAQGRAHLVFQFVLKIHAMCEPPRLLYAMAHRNQIKAREAVRRCLVSDSRHPKILELLADPVRAEAELFLEGDDLNMLPNLATFIAGFAFGFAVERLVEGDHAAIHRAYAKARYHTEALCSGTAKQ